MEEQGDLHGGEEGTEVSEGFPQYRPVFPTPAPCVRAPWRQRSAYRRMQVSCGGWGLVGHSPGDRGHLGPRVARDSPSPCHRCSCCFFGHFTPLGEPVLCLLSFLSHPAHTAFSESVLGYISHTRNCSLYQLMVIDPNSMSVCVPVLGCGKEGAVTFWSCSVLVQNSCECIMAESNPSIVPGDSWNSTFVVQVCSVAA